jgi:uncharacterized protein with FMN-binding domain
MIKTGKMLLSGGLILASGSYAWWHHMSQNPLPVRVAVPAPEMEPKPALALNRPAPAVTPPEAVTETPAPSTPDVTASAPAPAPQSTKPEKTKKSAPVAAVAPPPPATVAEPAAEPAPPPPPAAPLNAVALAPQPAISTGRYLDGEFIGNVSDGQWGPVQVKVVIRNGDIADVICLEYPIHRRRSAEISEWALPQLHEEAIKAQSAQIDWISQASFTSDNYQQSLASALSRAKKQP